MSGRGRPVIGPTIQTRFPPDRVEIIDSISEAEGEPRAEIIRDLVDEALVARGELDEGETK